MIKLISFLFLIIYSNSGFSATYTFGVIPQYKETTLRQMWDPFIAYLNNRTGYNFIFKTTSSIAEFEGELASGVYDFVYLGPLHYVIYHKSQGYNAFAKVRDAGLKGILVANINDTANSIEDVDNRSIVFPRNSFAASLVPRIILKKKKFNITPVFAATHEDVYDLVSTNLYGIGGGVEQTFNTLPNNIKSKLKIIWTSDVFAPHAFAVSSKISYDVVENVRTAMINMVVDSNENAMILNSIKFYNGFELATDSEWNEIRKLEIKNDQE